MTPDQAFTLGRDAVMIVIAVLVFYWGRDRKQAEQAIDARFGLLDQRLKDRDELHNERFSRIERSIEGANEESSRLTSRIQAIIGKIDKMPEELRKTFVSLERVNDLVDEARREHAAMWVAIKEGGRHADRQTLRDNS